MKKKEDLKDVIEGCRLGNRLSQKTLYRRFFNYGINVCNRYARSDEEAEEMLNDAFLRIFMKINLYDPALSFPAWLHIIIVRSAINYLKKYHRKNLTVEIELADHEPVIEENDLSLLSVEELVLLVRQLPPSYRAAFNLAVVEGYSHVEIAAMMGITEGASRMNLTVARRKLQLMILEFNKIKS